MKTNLFKIENECIRCLACAHKCLIKEGGRGICKIRRNENSHLVLDAYGSCAACGIDVIEKKPLYHFLPGSSTFSFGTLGCNFKCDFCQNNDIAMPKSLSFEKNLPPKRAVELTLKNKCASISYTYNEPAIFAEYAIDTAIIAKQEGLKNVLVTNGFLSEESLAEFAKVIDAVNIDLKSFSNSFYKKLCKGNIDPVLRAIEFFHKIGVWVEVTTLIIPGFNDSDEELKNIAKFISSVDKNIPWHISRFYPSHKMLNEKITPIETLYKAKKIGEGEGLSFVYVGNIAQDTVTICPKCKTDLIIRKRDGIISKLKGNKCICGYKLEGVFNE